MPRLTALLALALAACVAQPTQVASFRRPAAPIYSAAAFDPSRLAGDWRQVAAFAGSGTGCAAGAVSFKPQGTQLAIAGTLCLNGQTVRLSGPVRLAGPGRLAVGGMQDWWVLWVDSGYRTLAIGTPDGRFGFVLDRGRISADRLTAAAEIFEFNGYPKSRLQSFRP